MGEQKSTPAFMDFLFEKFVFAHHAPEKRLFPSPEDTLKMGLIAAF